MIYLWTGEPGDGKSNAAISYVKAESEKSKRPVYYAGIEILDPVALPWRKIEPDKWYEAPVGAIVLLDECQTTFEPRMRGKTQPDFARQLETHRHSGIDLHLVTQHPTLLDAHDRKLVGTHFYVRRKMGGSWKTIYRFKGCADFPEKMRAKALDTSETSDNKAAFGWYKSTELNTAKRQIPKKVWLLLALVVAIPVVFGSVMYGFKDRRAVSVVAPGHAASGVVSGIGPARAAGRPGSEPLTADQYVAGFQPRVPGLAYTAPAYDSVTAVKHAPYPAACLTSKASGCRCFSQQATALDVPEALCQAIVARGFFIAWDVGSADLPPGQRISRGPGTPGAASPGVIGEALPDGQLVDVGGPVARRAVIGGGVLRSAPGFPADAESVASGGRAP